MGTADGMHRSGHRGRGTRPESPTGAEMAQKNLCVPVIFVTGTRRSRELVYVSGTSPRGARGERRLLSNTEIADLPVLNIDQPF